MVMFYFSRFNILVYNCFLIFQVLFYTFFFFYGHEIFLGLNIYMLFFNDINKSNPTKYIITEKKNPYIPIKQREI
jgi:hypothetical protein